ncbi:MAG: NAD(P)-binding protein [Verrucomicrobiota bacterium]
MRHVKYLILGAGPSGLTLAHTLHAQGIPLQEILVLEKESTAGGLCRSENVDGSPLDIGGGHFLDIKHKEVLEFLFRFMPESEWNRHERISRIRLNGQMVDHPLEANLWQFDTATQVAYLEAIAQAGCIRGEPAPESFAAWIRWKFGERIAEDYMLPYNRKIWSMDPDLLGTYWLHKLPNVSFRETLHSCIEGRPFGSLPAHGVFLYPKAYGYGEIWKRMAEALGESIQFGVTIDSIEIASLTVNRIWRADHIFSSVPWHAWPSWTNVPASIESDMQALCNVSIDVDYVPETLDEASHWIYEPDESVQHHRKLLRSNFCPGAKGYWTETNSKRARETVGWRHTNPYAYPVNTVDKPLRVARILEWAKQNQITGFGRWGTWDHMNSDIAVKNAMELGKLTAP